MKSLKPVQFVLTLLVLTLMLMSLVACQTTGSVATDKSVACQAFKPIYWSKDDTVDTAKQVIEHNAVWKKLCTSEKPEDPKLQYHI